VQEPDRGIWSCPTEAFGIIVWKIRKLLGGDDDAGAGSAGDGLDQVVRTGGGGSDGAQEEGASAVQRPSIRVASLRNQHRFSTRLPLPFSKWGLMAVPEINQYAGRHPLDSQRSR
jgi:hypothetical protein